MSKTTFLGYVPSLKSKHEATIVGHKAIQSKGGSIRYTLQGEYQGRKTLPKTVSKADFESVYGFDAKAAEEAVYIKGKNPKDPKQEAMFYQVGKEDDTGFTPEKIVPIRTMNEHGRKKVITAMKEADTVGNPSPATINQPAPSEDPFPQEPSNASFSAENNDNKEYHISTYLQEEIDGEKNGWANWYLDGTGIEKDLDWEVSETKKTYEEAVDYIKKENEETPFAYAAIWEWDFDAYGGDGDYTKNYEIIIWTDPEVYEDLQNYFIEQEINWETADDIRQTIVDFELTKSYPNTNIILNDEGSMKAFIRALNKKERVHDYNYSFSAEMIECGNCDETFTIDEGLDIGGIDYCEECYDTLSAKEVKEAFGFGKEDEEEESEEPKTQEFTVVMQEGDKLELTDITEEEEQEETEEQQPADDEPKEEDSPEESENEEKEAEKEEERWALGLDHRQGGRGIHTVGCSGNKNTYFQEGRGQNELIRNWREDSDTFTSKQIAQEIYTNLENSESLDERRTGNTLKELIKAQSGLIKLHNCCKKVNTDNLLSTTFIVNLDAESYQAVQAKVTRPVKEDETEDEEESDEGLSTGAKVALGVGALAAGVALFGAEDDYIPYESETDYTEIYGAETFEAGFYQLEVKYNMEDGWEHIADYDNVDDGCDAYFDSYLEYPEVKLLEVDEDGDSHVLYRQRNHNVKGKQRDERFEATTGYGYDDPPERMTDEEGWLEMYDDYLEDEDSPMTLEEYKKWVIEAREKDYQMQIKYEQRLKDEGLDDLGNPIGTEYGFETEIKEAESKNLKLALGITAVGIGLAAVIGKDKIKTLFDRFGL